MSYSVFTIPPFDKQLKRLIKKFPSLKKEYAELIASLENDPMQGNAMAKSCFKIRIAIKSKGKGKRGGARVIAHVQVVDNIVYLLTIYDKSEQNDITEKEIEYLLSFVQE